MNNQQFERLVANLQDVMRCPHCSSKYSLDDVSYLGQLDSMTFLHMKCGECNSPVFASVATNSEEGDIFPVDITADDIGIAETSPIDEGLYDEELSHLGFEQRTIEIDQVSESAKDIPIEHIEAEKVLRALNPVSYDEVLDVHQYLESFEGDFEKFLV